MIKEYREESLYEEYKDVQFESHKSLIQFAVFSFVLALILGCATYYLFKTCYNYEHDAPLFLALLTSLVFSATLMFVFILVSIPRDFRRLNQYLAKKEIVEKKKQEREVIRQNIQNKYPHAYKLGVYGIEYHKFLGGYYNEEEVRNLPFSHRKKKNIDVASINEDEWKDRENAAVEVEKIIEMRNEINKHICKFPLSFFKFCIVVCKIQFQKGLKETMFLPGTRVLDSENEFENIIWDDIKFESKRYHWSQVSCIEYYPWHLRKKECVIKNYKNYILFGTRPSDFPHINSCDVKHIYEKLDFIDSYKMKEENTLLVKEIADENKSIMYFHAIRQNDRSNFVDDFYNYMNVTDEKEDFILSHLDELDMYAGVQKLKSQT